jgi:uncharacterized membrane protein YfcA
MEIVLGFVIAAAIGLTGVGGGVITAPVLILWLGVPPAVAVGTALAFVSVVKTLAVPIYVRRKQVDWRVLRWMLLGGLPGAVGGALLLRYTATKGRGETVLAAIGVVVIVSAAFSLARTIFGPKSVGGSDRLRLLGALSAAIGAEVGFSSAGAGALGTIALFQFSSLTAPAVVGTDLAFGLVVSLAAGGLHFVSGAFDAVLLVKLIAGGVVGVTLGARLTSVVPTRVLRVAILLWVTGLGIQLFLRAAGSWLRAGW